MFKAWPPHAQRVESPGCCRTHTDHVEVESAVAVKVIQAMGHAESVMFIHPGGRDFGECAIPFVFV